MNHPLSRHRLLTALVGAVCLTACTSPAPTARVAAAPAPPVTVAAAPEAIAPTPAAPVAVAPVAAAPAPAPAPAPVAPTEFVAPPAANFEDAVTRAGDQLIRMARVGLGNEDRNIVIDPLIDANTGAQTVSTVRMGSQLESVVKSRSPGWAIQPLTRQSLATQPLLMIGTLTPINTERSVDKQPDAFRVWLTLIDLRTGKVVAKQLDRSTVDSVNPEPLKYYRDSPTWHKDKTVQGYINSCQINTKIGDPADPEYLARLPAAAVVNEAIMAYSEGKLPLAHKLYKEAEPIADPGDLRVLNGLYLTNWQLGQRDEAKQVFSRLVASGFDLKRLPVKILFQPGKTEFLRAGDLPEQYGIWLNALASEAGKVNSCVRVVGHTSRTGSASLNETLSRQRAEAVEKLLERQNRVLAARLTATGVGSREALIGLGTDDQRDALDRRVEFRVVDCV